MYRRARSRPSQYPRSLKARLLFYLLHLLSAPPADDSRGFTDCYTLLFLEVPNGIPPFSVSSYREPLLFWKKYPFMLLVIIVL